MKYHFFSKEKQVRCFCRNIIEKYNNVNEKGRDPIFHLLYDGAPARFLRSHLRIYARRILGQAFDININSILFNETRSCAALRAADLGLSGQDAFRGRTFGRFPASLFSPLASGSTALLDKVMIFRYLRGVTTDLHDTA